MNPLVSVIVAARDEARFIGAALDSVFAQSHRPLEVIVADDGSTDDTAEIAERRGARVLPGPHGGTGAARNAALAVATGEYWTPFDADDLMPAGRLTVQVAALEADPGLGYVTGLTEALTAPDERRPTHYEPGWDGAPRPGHPGTMLARRELLTLVGPYDQRFGIAEDVDWLIRAGELGVRARGLDEICLRYRIHGGNKTADIGSNHQDLLAILRASVKRRRAQSAGPDDRG